MGDAPTRLDRERESVMHVRRPFLEHVLPGQAIERVVDLDDRIPAGVVAEHRVVLQAAWVERSLPLLEGESARTHEHVHDTFRSGSSDSEAEFARLCLS